MQVQNISQTTNKKNAVEMLINYLPVGLAFLMPLFFLPITSEYFEFNKLALLTATTIALVVLWSIRMLVDSKVYLTKSKLDLPILVFLGAFIASTIFSIDQTSSIFGKYGRWYPSLSGIATLVAFYYIVSANLKSKKIIKFILNAFVIGGTISTFVTLLRYFGVNLGNTPYLQAPAFTTTGAVISAATLAALAATTALTLLSYEKNKNIKYGFLASIAINVAAVALINVLAAWATLAAGVILYLIFVPANKISAKKVEFTALGGIFAAIILVTLLPQTREVIVNQAYPTELTLGAQESWIIASSALRDRPIVGSGPSTFHLNFPTYRPVSLNSTDAWNIRFDKPQSELFSIIASLGLVGILATIYLVAKVVRFALNHNSATEETGINAALNIATLSILIMFLFTYATVLTAFLLFLFLGMSVAKAAIDMNTKNAESVYYSITELSVGSMSILSSDGKREILQYIVAVPMILAAVGVSYYGYRVYAAEYYLRAAINAARENNGGLTYELQAKAINTNPRRDNYHNVFIQTNIALANVLASNPELSDQDRVTIQQLIAQSTRSSKITTEQLNPLNVANWETRARVYRTLIGVAGDAEDWAIRAYNNAIQLDPTNPRLRVDLGGIYYAQGEFLSAANLFREATRLKPDYANAHYNFASALRELGFYQDAAREFQITANLLPQESPDRERIEADLAGLVELAQAAVAGAQDQRPTVDEIESEALPQDETTQPTEQEPLTNVGEQTEAQTLPQEALPDTNQDLNNQDEVQNENENNEQAQQETQNEESTDEEQ